MIVNLQWLNLNRAIISWRFLLYSSLICLAMIIATLPLLQKTPDVVDLTAFALTGSHGSLMLVLATLPLMTYTISFAIEWEQKAVLPWIIRTGAYPYAICKVVTSVISAFLTMIMGCTLFIIIMSFKFPLYKYGYAGDTYHVLLESNHIFTYFTLYIIDFALVSFLFAGIAFFVSTLIPNKFVVLTAPVVIYFVVHRLTSSLPQNFRAVNLVEGSYNIGSPLSSLLLKLAIVMGITIILSLLSVILIKRRVQRV